MATIHLRNDNVHTSIVRMGPWTKSVLGRAALSLASILAASGFLSGQSVAIAVTPGIANHTRPVYAAIQRIQKLTPIPINYEDLQYNSTGDVSNIASLGKSAAPKRQVLVPVGGSFSIKCPGEYRHE